MHSFRQDWRALTMITRKPNADDAFTIERHGEITVITATPALEGLAFGLEEQAAELILNPLLRQENPLILFDMSQVDYFGSMFLALLIRCWKLAISQGGSMALSGISERTRELLRVTSLDIVWPIYDSKPEAMAAFELD
jgi:anti-sigma B factor antagonist